MRKPKRLARTIRFTTAFDVWRGKPVARFHLATAHRNLKGKLSEWFLAKGAEGSITFLDKTPRDTDGHVLVVGLPNGILVVGRAWFNGEAPAMTVAMCNTYRNRIVGGVGKIRWARVKAVAA